ncbi:MAG: tRNA 2-selenouridine(34) synthase MnmH [Bacteroidetes bacterium]|nr:tRNA 2-selenouridine(34) synthase MnmH [Bacteroidota bacterium]MDA1268783.1 tRNA 2-selenouridine(34) synthase MnmH [Bacteroidota bacterium]
MAEFTLTLENFWTLREQLPLVDARSEGEFEQSHIPRAINIPILSNKERVLVGTLYKNAGSEKAILKGFELVGPRFHLIQREALRNFPDKKLMIYCWRGGMRSQILSWLLTQVGFEVYRLAGGYKTYRSFTFDAVRKPYPLLVLGGKTGTAKTVLLQKLKERGEQVVDLEGLANHKGSSFGAIGQPNQPSVEQFENLFAEQLREIHLDQALWVENESRRIGRIILPDSFYLQMTQSPRIEIEKTNEERTAHIASEYASLDQVELSAAVQRLQKRLGGDRTKQALEAIQANQPEIWIPILLQYYDKTYEFDLQRHEALKTIRLNLQGIALDTQVNLLLQTKPKGNGTTHPTHGVE